VLTQPHNQAKSWEYFHNFVAAVGICFLVSRCACTTKSWEYFRDFVAVMRIFLQFASCLHNHHNQAKLWEYFRTFIACMCRLTVVGKFCNFVVATFILLCCQIMLFVLCLACGATCVLPCASASLLLLPGQHCTFHMGLKVNTNGNPVPNNNTGHSLQAGINSWIAWRSTSTSV